MMAHRISLRRAASLPDVLVVLFILVVTLALTAPAIKRVDEAAKKKQCQKNLQRIGIASHNYHNDYQRLPPGYYGPVLANGNSTNVAPDQALDRGPWAGVMVTLLPYLEQNRLYKQLWRTDKTFPAAPADPEALGWSCGLGEERKAWWTNKENLATAAIRLNVLTCPSDNVNEATPEGVLYTIHLDNEKFQTMLGPESLGRTNYAGVAGTTGNYDPGKSGTAPYNQYPGIMVNRNKVTLGQITVQDGTSNTLMFGESLGGSGVGKRDRAWSWFGVGAMATAHGLGKGDTPAAVEPPELGKSPAAGQNGAQWYRFSSRHEKSVQFCYGDVHVSGLRFGNTTEFKSNDWFILQALAGRKDGDNRDVSSLIDN
jgi:hypothetical protein